ncbi:MAG: cupin domain-containing protein [Ilumatobacteraceae bacterium]
MHRRAEKGFTDLLDVDDVEQLLALLARRPHFRLVKDGATLPIDSYTTTARVGGATIDGVADVDRMVELVADGATVVLQGLQRTWLPLADFCDQLQAEISHPVQANAYLSPRQAAALARHTDTHAVFALQVAGRKRWTVEGLDEVVMEPGDVLYLPAGTAHDARSLDVFSLHLTIGVLAVTWRDVVRRVLADGPDDLDAPLPLGYADRPEQLARALSATFDAVGRHLATVDVAAVATGEAVRAERARRSMPSGRLRATLDPASIADGTRLARRMDAELIDRQHDGVAVQFAGRRLALPAAARPALAAILQSDELAVADLPGLDEPSRAVLARRLIREGLLRPVAE